MKRIILFSLLCLVAACTYDSNDKIRSTKESEENYVSQNILEITLKDGTHCAVYRGYNMTCGWRQ